MGSTLEELGQDERAMEAEEGKTKILVAVEEADIEMAVVEVVVAAGFERED